MIKLTFPQKLYATEHQFNDYGTDDMRYGDITAARLKKEFRLTNISNVVDPWTMTRLTVFDNPQSRFFGAYGNNQRSTRLSAKQCASLLFEEMQVTSLPFACVGPWKYLINRMLQHFQSANGMPFNDMALNAAYQAQIINDNTKNSTLTAIREEISTRIDYENGVLPLDNIPFISKQIKDRILPKFDSTIVDKINGLGITVHDVYATRINLLSLEISKKGWCAQIKYSGQDHFGLDVNDIQKVKFNQFQFFRIWFILQRFDQFGFRPFLTNMEATITLEGKRS
ncbi:hypothetical protein B1H58_06045 [Pantoea alhagi]|uniref:DUF3289 domain-containing protein n=1 Tax=Pantoea alhagi TaxID=1891675 RepID=A0A1W6B3D8_9GAMM|nr:DUF3289 family protein [Pantoea alhagi]ARJ41620.1 hypothetical protein B1H58_06045 [Pantoea alhagi]